MKISTSIGYIAVIKKRNPSLAEQMNKGKVTMTTENIERLMTHAFNAGKDSIEVKPKTKTNTFPDIFNSFMDGVKR